jgi:hypothetical protein
LLSVKIDRWHYFARRRSSLWVGIFEAIGARRSDEDLDPVNRSARVIVFRAAANFGQHLIRRRPRPPVQQIPHSQEPFRSQTIE